MFAKNSKKSLYFAQSFANIYSTSHRIPNRMNYLYSSQKKTASFWLDRRRFLGSPAFSLVEVTLALGLVTFSVITLMGMIPMGLTTFHKAAATSVSSQIVQQVVTDVQQSDFSQLVTANSPLTRLSLRYFDDQGNELGLVGGVPPASPPPGTVYNVNVVVKTPVVLTGGSPTDPSNLACLAIEIVSNPGNIALTYDSNDSVVQDTVHGISVSRYSAFVAKNSNN
jgi:uncharacterized protein (TIGR02598 family)